MLKKSVNSDSGQGSGSEVDQVKDGSCDLFSRLAKQAWFIAASYFYSMEVFAVSFLPKALGLNNGTGLVNNTEYQAKLAGATLAPVVFNTIVIIVESTIFAYNVVLSGDLGRLDDLQAELGELEASEDARQLKMRISATNRNGIIWALTLSPFAMFPLYYSADLLTLCGQDYNVSQEAQEFLRPTAFAVPALYLALAFEKIIFSFRHTLATMLLGLTSFVIGTASAIGLALSTNLGMYGMAVAYMGSNYLAMLAYGLYLACAKDMRPYQFFNFGRLGFSHFDQLTDILKMGLPMMVSTASDNIVALLLGVFAGLMGKEQLGALNAIMSLYFFVFILSGSHAESTCQELRRAIKEKKYEKANKISKNGLLVTVAGALPACAASVVVLNALTGEKAFFADRDFLLFSAAMLVGIFQKGILMQLRALLFNLSATGIDAVCMLLGLAGGAIVGLLTPLDVTGLALGFAAGSVSSFSILLCNWCRLVKQDVIQQRVAYKQRKEKKSARTYPSLLNDSDAARALTESLLPETNVVNLS